MKCRTQVYITRILLLRGKLFTKRNSLQKKTPTDWSYYGADHLPNETLHKRWRPQTGLWTNHIRICERKQAHIADVGAGGSMGWERWYDDRGLCRQSQTPSFLRFAHRCVPIIHSISPAFLCLTRPSARHLALASPDWATSAVFNKDLTELSLKMLHFVRTEQLSLKKRGVGGGRRRVCWRE